MQDARSKITQMKTGTKYRYALITGVGLVASLFLSTAGVPMERSFFPEGTLLEESRSIAPFR
tara:strand:+ start:324 stop:509 length:186 start_codon:yes stop_codon:yes gene_type:complete